MQRLSLLVPDVEKAKQIVDELQQAGIEERYIHLIAKDHMQLEKANLQEAGLLERSEFLPAVERGAAVGGATGILAGIAAVTFPPAGLVVGGGAILSIGLLGAGLGAWISSTVGNVASERQLEELEQAVEQGQLLLLIDAPKDRVAAISELIEKHGDLWIKEE